MEGSSSWALPNDSVGILESIKVTELGYVQAKFRIKDELDGCDTFVNYTIGKLGELLAEKQIYTADLTLVQDERQ